MSFMVRVVAPSRKNHQGGSISQSGRLVFLAHTITFDSEITRFFQTNLAHLQGKNTGDLWSSIVLKLSQLRRGRNTKKDFHQRNSVDQKEKNDAGGQAMAVKEFKNQSATKPSSWKSWPSHLGYTPRLSKNLPMLLCKGMFFFLGLPS